MFTCKLSCGPDPVNQSRCHFQATIVALLLIFRVALKSNVSVGFHPSRLKKHLTSLWDDSEWALANSAHCLGRIEPGRLEFFSN